MEEQMKTDGSSSLLSRLTGNLGIRGKILLGFMAILALTAIIAAVALIGQRYSNNTVDQMINVHNRVALLSLETQGHVGDMFQQDALFRQNYAVIGLQIALDEGRQSPLKGCQGLDKLCGGLTGGSNEVMMVFAFKMMEK